MKIVNGVEYYYLNQLQYENFEWCSPRTLQYVKKILGLKWDGTLMETLNYLISISQDSL